MCEGKPENKTVLRIARFIQHEKKSNITDLLFLISLEI